MIAVPPAPTPLPRAALLRWLVDAGPDVPQGIRSTLLDEMVGAPAAALAGPLNGLVINVVALCLHGGRAFVALLAAESVLLALRVGLLLRGRRNHRRGAATPPDLYLTLAIAWCALQGALAWACITSAILPLQIISATSVMALIGPICGRNYGAPRFAMLLLALCYLPLIAGAQTLRQPWLLVMAAQGPLLFIGAGTILRRYRTLSITALQGQAASQHRAAHDSLTGLLNRTGLADALPHEHAIGQPFVLYCLDLDGFKPVNDTYGHQAGDVVLAAIGERLRTHVRRTDIVARLGGDEFVVVTTGMPEAEAARYGEQIIRWIADRPYRLDDDRCARIGVSVGYACAPADGLDPETLRRHADTALYAAKAAGKGVCRRYAATAMPEPAGTPPAAARPL
jgi:diguanylate cyclase (GGDEF)-like protein